MKQEIYPQWTHSQRRLKGALGIVAGLLLLVSLFVPYWQARLFAPQYRHGLAVTMYAYKVGGDVREIDGLNHYVGVAKLGDLAKIERKLAVPAVILLAVFCFLIPHIKSRSLQWFLSAGIIFYPILFLADLKFWLYYASTHLDPTAPLKLKPFAIPLYGLDKVGQFRSEVGPMPGFYLIALAALLILTVLLLPGRAKAATEKTKYHVPEGGWNSGRKFLGPIYAWFLVLLLASLIQAQKTLQDRIDSAPEGSVLEISGLHSGPVDISKSLHLKGMAQAMIDGGNTGTVVTIRAPGVTLENLTIKNSGESFLMEDSGVRVEAASAAIRNCVLENVLFGFFLAHAPASTLENNQLSGKDLDLSKRGDLIRLWYSDRATIRGNHLRGGRDAVLWFSTGSIVESNVFRGGRYGLHFMYTQNAQVLNNAFHDNSVGAYIMYSQDVALEKNRFENNRGPSGLGLGLKESDRIKVVENFFKGNRQGLFIDQSPLVPENVNHFLRNVFAHNDIGVAILPGAKGDVFSENSFQDNLQQVSVRGGGELGGTLWHEGGKGNFWSDYTGYGLAKSLVGRLPYRVESAFESLVDRFPSVRFFSFTPASSAIELAARAFPLFKPKPKLTDPYPLLEAPKIKNILNSPNQKQAGIAGPLLLFAGALALPFFLLRKRGSKTLTSSGKNKKPASEFVVEAQGVSKSFGRRAILQDFNLEMTPGESVVLWGANGAGKSTFLKCLLGIQSFHGAIRICGHDVQKEGKAARGRVGYLPQEFSGYDWTVQETLEFVCRIRQINLSVIPDLLKTCRLEGEERKLVPALSGGMKQKLALAQALTGDPDLLVLDEPCSNLDLKTRHEFLGILHRMKGSRSLLLTSHRIEEVDHLADRVVWLEEGKSPKALTVPEFYEAVSTEVILWVGLQAENVKSHAIELLRQAGYAASPDGQGVWVEAHPKRKMEIVRLLERSDVLVEDIREEERP